MRMHVVTWLGTFDFQSSILSIYYAPALSVQAFCFLLIALSLHNIDVCHVLCYVCGVDFIDNDILIFHPVIDCSDDLCQPFSVTHSKWDWSNFPPNSGFKESEKIWEKFPHSHNLWWLLSILALNRGRQDNWLIVQSLCLRVRVSLQQLQQRLAGLNGLLLSLLKKPTSLNAYTTTIPLITLK